LPEFICNTSPLQYLHQLGWLEILLALTGRVVIPPAVANELSKGVAAGWDIYSLPWIRIQVPASTPALPLAADLGRGEAGVLALALESTNPLVILDDARFDSKRGFGAGYGIPALAGRVLPFKTARNPVRNRV
jgi:uncharacterized protein